MMPTISDKNDTNYLRRCARLTVFMLTFKVRAIFLSGIPKAIVPVPFMIVCGIMVPASQEVF